MFHSLRRSTRTRRRAASHCQLEELECRRLLTSYAPPSGDASVTVENGDILVDNPQGLHVSSNGDEIVFSVTLTNGSVTVNGESEFRIDADQFTGDMHVTGGYVFAADAMDVPGDFTITDTVGWVNVSGLNVEGDFNSGLGARDMSITDSRIRGTLIDRSSGFDPFPFTRYHLRVLDSTVGTDFKVVGNPDSTGVQINGSVVHGRTTIRTGFGEDRIAISESQFEDQVFVNMGSGDDEFASEDSEFASPLQVHGGKGKDEVESTSDSFVSRVHFSGGNGQDYISVVAPTFWGAERHELFDRLIIRGDGGYDNFALRDPMVTVSRFTGFNRRKPFVAEDAGAERAIELADELVEAGNGFATGVRKYERDTDRPIYIVSYPTTSANYFESGRPRVRVDLLQETATLLPPVDSTPVEFHDAIFSKDWWRDLPS